MSGRKSGYVRTLCERVLLCGSMRSEQFVFIETECMRPLNGDGRYDWEIEGSRNRRKKRERGKEKRNKRRKKNYNGNVYHWETSQTERKDPRSAAAENEQHASARVKRGQGSISTVYQLFGLIMPPLDLGQSRSEEEAIRSLRTIVAWWLLCREPLTSGWTSR